MNNLKKIKGIKMTGKIIFFVVIATIICIGLTGCENKNGKDTESNSETQPIVEINEIELFSDDKKIVYKDGEEFLSYIYSGDTIVGYSRYKDCGDAKKANEELKTAEEQKTAEKDEKIIKIYTTGKYLVIDYARSEFEGKTVDDIKNINAGLEEVKK